MKQSDIIPSRSWLLRWFGGLDRFDVGIVIALIISFVAVAMLPFAPKKFGDMDFHVEAKALALAIQRAGPWTDVALTKAPAPVLYYLIPYLIVPPGSEDHIYWLAAFIWTIGWMVLSVLLIRRIGKMIGGPLVGRLAAIFTIMSMFGIYYSYGILAEPPAYIGVVLFTYGWARWRTSGYSPSPFRKELWLAWTGLSLFVLSRPNALLVLPVALFAAVTLWLTKSPEQRMEAKFAVSCVAVVSLVVAMSSALVTVLPGRPNAIRQSEYLAHVVFHGRFQYRTEPWDWRFWDESTRRGSADYATWVHSLNDLKRQSSETGIPISDLQWRWVFNDVVDHPGIMLQMATIRTLSLHMAFVNSVKPEAFGIGPLSGKFVYTAFHIIVNGLNFLFVGSSIWFLVTRRREFMSYWALWGPWVALLAFHVATYAETRYMFPSQPVLVVMGAAALAPAMTHIKSRIG